MKYPLAFVLKINEVRSISKKSVTAVTTVNTEREAGGEEAEFEPSAWSFRCKV